MKKLQGQHRRRSKKMKPSEMSIVVLSDSDNDSETEKVITIDESDTTVTDPEIEVITLDDSVVANQLSFRIDVTPGPDFIPLGIRYKKPKKKVKRKRLNLSREVTVMKVRKCLTEDQITFNRTAINSGKSKFEHNTNTMVADKPNVTQTTSTKSNTLSHDKREYDFRKPKIPQIHLSHTNILNTVNTPLTEGLRPVIIDGCNVAFGFGNGEFSIQGIIYVVQYFKNRGHEEIVCFLPQNYRNKLRLLSVGSVIKEYEKQDIIVYTPSRFLNGKLIKPYDDRFIVQYASERGGVIISNDGYQDLINEEPSWRTTIEQRIVNFTFARGIFMLPKDPLGPDGPTLDEMLKFP